MRKQIPPEKTKDVIAFASKAPPERLKSIREGLGVLAWGQSEYVRQFGLSVKQTEPLSLNARVLAPPKLLYGTQSKQPTIQPREGAWNMMDKKFYKPMTVRHWVILVYERPTRFPQAKVDQLKAGFIEGCEKVGMVVINKEPPVTWENAQGSIQTVSHFLSCL